MLRMTKLLFFPVMAAILIVGCSQDQSSTTTGPADLSFSTAALLAGAEVQSATLYVHVSTASGNDVFVHRVTSEWDEMAVTFNSFGGAFDASSEGSFLADAYGWKTVDVTNLARGWLAGEYANFGLLLKHGELAFPRSLFYSRETDRQPTLEICYMTADGPECVQLIAVADTYIWESEPNSNRGALTRLYAGWQNETDLEKQTLIRFELPELPEPAAIGDFVWYDANNDGIQDTNELGAEGVTVNLFNCDDIMLSSMMTNADGYYLFDNLIPGDYYVEFVLPEGHVFSPQDQGVDDAVDSDAGLDGVTVCTTLEPGETDLTWDAGLYMPEGEGCSLTIGFWKTHAGFGPQDDVVTPLLPISLGAIDVTNATEAHDILVQKYCGGPSNGIVKLTAQFLAVMLNGANSADLGAVAGEIETAHQILTDYSCEDWKKGLTKAEKKDVNSLKSTFDDYNNGLIGPGHCDFFGDDD